MLFERKKNIPFYLLFFQISREYSFSIIFLLLLCIEFFFGERKQKNI